MVTNLNLKAIVWSFEFTVNKSLVSNCLKLIIHCLISDIFKKNNEKYEISLLRLKNLRDAFTMLSTLIWMIQKVPLWMTQHNWLMIFYFHLRIIFSPVLTRSGFHLVSLPSCIINLYIEKSNQTILLSTWII